MTRFMVWEAERRAPAKFVIPRRAPKVACHPGSEFLQPCAAMVHHITLFKLKPEVTPQKLEQMLMTTRMSLLKIPEILSVKCGKAIDPKNEWPFFVSLEFESMEKLVMTQDDAIYMKFVAEVIKTNTTERLAMDYEMEPGKKVKFS